jgi:hypothetical protein
MASCAPAKCWRPASVAYCARIGDVSVRWALRHGAGWARAFEAAGAHEVALNDEREATAQRGKARTVSARRFLQREGLRGLREHARTGARRGRGACGEDSFACG